MNVKFGKTLHEIYESRNVLRSLICKDLFGRYKNSTLGFAWHFITPIMMLIVYYVVFTTIRSSSFDDFWIYLASGIFPLNYLMVNLVNGSSCMVGNAALIKKIYFPREIIAIAHIVVSLVIMTIGLLIVVLSIILLDYPVNYSLLLLPIGIVLLAIFSTGMVLFFSSITVYVRDIYNFLTTISIVFYFITPVYFTISESTSRTMDLIIYSNPFSYFIEFFHHAIYYGTYPDIILMGACFILASSSFIIGLITFNKLKGGFAERL